MSTADDDLPADSDLLAFNGINGSTGASWTPDLTVEQVSRVAQGNPLSAEELADAEQTKQVAHLGVGAGIDVTDLAATGWAIIFAHDDPRGEAIAEQLAPLLERREAQAGELFRRIDGAKAYRPGESKLQFLRRFGVGPGPVVPKTMPYYLLLIGSPEQIPYRVQFQLDVQYAVGRLHFDDLADYGKYAANVVAAEKGEIRRQRSAYYFAVKNKFDKATNLSSNQLVKPLHASLAADEDLGWQHQVWQQDQAKKAALKQLLEDDQAALLFTASHGVGFDLGDERQLEHQGALLCQDWPGPLHWQKGKPIPAEHYFSADDLDDSCNVRGLVAFFFACYGLGTPKLDQFAVEAGAGLQKEIAPHDFVAKLPQAMLARGALAVVGHIDRAWGWSFVWENAGPQIEVFRSALLEMLVGRPLGAAMEYFGQRYGEISTDLHDEQQNIKFGAPPNDRLIANLWTANNDARGYAILGDPAVRLPID